MLFVIIAIIALYFIRINYKKYKSQITNFFIIFLILFFSSLIYKMHDDFPYYHFPYTYILTQNNFNGKYIKRSIKENYRWG